MAPLTWRNVDQPNFTGPNDMFRLAAGLMNGGFDAARRGISDFRNTTTEEQSAALMQSVIAAGDDPAAIQAAVAGGNSAFLSPQALQFANNQPGVLLDRQGKGLSNQISGQQIRMNDFNYGRAEINAAREDENYNLLPSALAEASQITEGLQSADPATRMMAQSQQADFMARNGRALGIKSWNDLNNFNTSQTQGALNSMTLDERQRAFEIGIQDSARTNNVRGIVDNALAYSQNNPAEAIRMLQGFTDLDYETQAAAIAEIQKYAPTLAPTDPGADLMRQLDNATGNGSASGPVPTTAGALPQANRNLPANYQPIIYNNKGATRNLEVTQGLSDAMSVVGQKHGVTFRVNSGGQTDSRDPALQNVPGGWTGSDRHNHGNAADVNMVYEGRNLSWENPQDQPIMQAVVADLKAQGLTGFGAGQGYMNPETTHIGFGNPAVWGAKGGSPYEALTIALSGAKQGNAVAAGGGRPQSPNIEARYAEGLAAVDAGKDYVAPLDPSRPQLQNADGTVSTEETSTFEIGGTWFNIPTIVDGERLSEDEAFTAFQEGRNPAVGIFQSQRAAEKAAEERTDMLGTMLAEAAANPAPAPGGDDVVSQALSAAATEVPTVNNTVQTAPTAADPVTAAMTAAAATDDRPQYRQFGQSGGLGGDLLSVGQNVAEIGVNSLTRPINALGGLLNGGLNYAFGEGQYIPQIGGLDIDQDGVSADATTGVRSLFGQDVRDNPPPRTQAPAEAPASSNGSGSSGNQTITAKPNATRADMDNMFDAVIGTANMNAAADQNGNVSAAIASAEGDARGVGEIARDLKDNVFKEIDYTHISNEISRLSRQLRVDPSVAAAILQAPGVTQYNEGIFGIGKGFKTDDGIAREVWSEYNNGKGGANAATNGAMDYVNREATQRDVAEVQSIRANLATFEDQVAAALADPNTPPDRRELFKERLAQLRQQAQAQLMEITGRGNLQTRLVSQTAR